MPIIRDIVTTAVEQKRDLRFWHDARRVTLSPYLFGTTADGDTIVAGVTSDGGSMSILRSEMIGIELTKRTGHPPAALTAQRFEKTWAVSAAS